jgi:hypothetical protein
MHITVPDGFGQIAWEGEVATPVDSSVFRDIRDPQAPVLTVGRPEVWNVEDVMPQHTGQVWIPPLGDGHFWLVRVAITLQEPEGRSRISGAKLSLFIQSDPTVEHAEAYAFTLIPERVGADTKREWTAVLEPSLKAAEVADVKAGRVGVTMDFSQVYPVIQAFGVGTPYCGWTFQPHPKAPIAGSQFLYVVIAARPAAQRVRISLGFVAEIETKIGLIQLQPPQTSQGYLQFTIPA